MPQRSFSDVTPPERPRRLLSDVLPNPSVRRGRPAASPPPPPPPRRNAPIEDEMRESNKKNPWRTYILVGTAALIVVGLGVYAFMEKATVTLERKVTTAKVDAAIVARESDGGAELSYVVVRTEKTLEKEVPATGESYVERKATGTITIYNNFSSASQRLVKNTRFETPDGRIYRIGDSVVVPGRTGSGASAVPGRVDAIVTADAAGEAFNVQESDFTIPGFKGDPRYQGFYARTKTPIGDGFTGTIKTAKPEDIEAARRELDLSLQTELLAQAIAELPPDYILFENAAAIRYEDASPEGSSKVVRKGTLTGILFPTEALAAALAGRSGVATEGAPLHIENVTNTVAVQFLSPITVESLSTKKMDVRFSGESVRFVFDVDMEALRNDLVGKPKIESITNEVFGAYPGIRDAQISVSPFWKGSLPGDVEDIRIKDETPRLEEEGN